MEAWITWSAMCFLGCLGTIILLPILLSFWLVSLVIFITSLLLIKLKYGSLAYLASGTDVLHGKESKNTVPVINTVMRLKSNPGVKEIQQRFLNLIHNTRNKNGQLRYKKMTERLVSSHGYKIWKCYPSFDIEHHIKPFKLREYIAAPSGADIENEKISLDDAQDRCCEWENSVVNFLNQNGFKSFDRQKPLWELHVSSDEENRCTLIFRFHHAMTDGIYALRMMHEDIANEKISIFKNRKTPTLAQRMVSKISELTLLPVSLYKMMTQSDKNPLHGPELSGKKSYFLSGKISMNKFSQIKSNNKVKPQVSSHCIVMSCLSHSIAELFAQRDSREKWLTALKPIPMQLPNSEIGLKNEFAVLNFKLPTTSRSKFSQSVTRKYPSLHRLAMVQNSLQCSRNDFSAFSLNSLIENICTFFPFSMAERLLSVKGCSMAVSHLPGSESMIEVFGSKVDDMMFWVPDREPLGVGFSVFTYNGFIRIGLSIDDALLSSDQEGKALMRNFEIEIENLVKETSSSRASDTFAAK